MKDDIDIYAKEDTLKRDNSPKHNLTRTSSMKADLEASIKE